VGASALGDDMTRLTENELAALVTAAAEADRLRLDPAFQAAILALRASAVSALQAEEQAVLTAMLNGQPTNIEAVRTKQAEIKAIDGFCQELASAILRVPRKPMAVA
jgi:predicted DNA-binding transcriptional regulator YafY